MNFYFPLIINMNFKWFLRILEILRGLCTHYVLNICQYITYMIIDYGNPLE